MLGQLTQISDQVYCFVRRYGWPAGWHMLRRAFGVKRRQHKSRRCSGVALDAHVTTCVNPVQPLVELSH